MGRASGHEGGAYAVEHKNSRIKAAKWAWLQLPRDQILSVLIVDANVGGLELKTNT